MANTVKMRIQIRRDTFANWELYKDIVPAEGEPCFITDKNILKIGDGKTAFGDLEPIGGVKLETAADGKSVVFEDNVFQLMGFKAAEVGAQPRKNKDGNLEWVVPSTETVDGLQIAVTKLQTDVAALQGDVTSLKAIIGSADEGSGTLLSRVEGLEQEMKAFVTSVNGDDKVNTLMELIDYVDTHGKEAAQLTSEIKSLQDLVGTDPVASQILTAIETSEKKAKALYEHVKYEITDAPAGTLIDYRDKEIRVMVPAGAQFTKQAVGEGGDADSYYVTFKTYAPNDNVVGYIEHLNGQTDSEILTKFSTDEYGRRYQPTWLAVAKYDEATGWSYYGASSTANKYLGYDYQIDWYDANGVVIASDKVRINLSNEDCHHIVEPYYMANVVKQVAVNGTLLQAVGGKVDITVPEFKSSDEISVNEDGSLSIKAISFDKIVQDEDDILVMNGGAAG